MYDDVRKNAHAPNNNDDVCRYFLLDGSGLRTCHNIPRDTAHRNNDERYAMSHTYDSRREG